MDYDDLTTKPTPILTQRTNSTWRSRSGGEIVFGGAAAVLVHLAENAAGKDSEKPEE